MLAVPADVAGLVRPEWPPLRHVHAGWAVLDEAERDIVRNRLADVLGRTRVSPRLPRTAVLRFFAFLAQVETIAIEIPMRFLPHAKAELQPALRRQLVDEVFHSVLFSRLAHDLALPAAQPPPPLPSAERLLEKIRAQEDLGITATLLNLAAEGWIETLFRHARRWGVADPVFQAVLEDEARHVHEATDYTENLDLDKARAPLADLERGLVELGSEPSVGLAMVQLAGAEGYQALVEDLHTNHVRHLALVGLEPSSEWREATAALEATMREAVASRAAPQPVEDTIWRAAARQLWSSPRDPTMQGEFTVPVGHFEPRLITPIFVAAVARAWAKHPELNVIIAQGRRWRLPDVQVGVRVMLESDELATVVIPQADTRSLRDISYMLKDGLRQLAAMRARRPATEEWPADLAPQLDPTMMEWVPPGPLSFAVSISNVGRFGLESGAGCLTGNYTPSTDLTIGARHRRPAWRGIGYFPAWHVRVGALQDHRIFDGNHAGTAMQAVKEHLTPNAVRAIARTPDTIPADTPKPAYDDEWFATLPPGLQALPAVGFVKFNPVVIGGALTLGAGLGVGGYFLYKALAGGAAAAAAPPPVPPGPGMHGPTTASHTAPGPYCIGVRADGQPCTNLPVPGVRYCAEHRR